MATTNFQEMKPRAVEAYLRNVILKTFGDKVENYARVYATHGRYNVQFDADGVGHQVVAFQGFRKSDVGKIAKAIRALK
jgi:hypothetical protein